MPVIRKLSGQEKAFTITLRSNGSKLNQIAGKFCNNHSYLIIFSEQLGISESTASKIIKKFRENHTLNIKPLSGRAKVLKRFFIKKILRRVDKCPSISFIEIASELQKYYGLAVSPRTIRRYLICSGLKSCRARHKPLLSYIQKIKRHAWAKEFINKPEEFWQNVLFSDETRISIFGSDRPPMVRRPINTSLDEKYLIPTIKYPTGVMIWSCFSFNGVGKIKIIDNTLDSAGYESILKNEVKESGDKLFNGKFIYQDDNAPCHRSHLIKKYFAENNSIDHIWWPSQSPDMNPIENLWAFLKRKVAKYKPMNKRELIKVIKNVWENEIPQHLLEKLIFPMKNRLEDLLKAKGGNTRY